MLLFLLCVLLQPAVVAAESLIRPAPYARHLAAVDDLNLGEVNDIMQDSQGYLWLGTSEGVVRFDGVSARRFAHDQSDSHSLSHNVVHGIVQDHNDNIWISTFGGLNKFDPRTEQFSKIELALNPAIDPLPEKLYGLSIDRQNTLWIGSTEGMIRLDIRSEKVIALEGPLAGLPKTVSSRAFVDNQGLLWFTTNFDGLFLYNGQSLRQFSHDPTNAQSISSNNIRALHQDREGTLWISTDKGLNKFNVQNQTFSHFIPSDSALFSNFEDDIFAVQSDGRGRLWLGTVNSGVLNFDIGTSKFQPVSGIPDLHHQFKLNRVNQIIKDKDGSLWFATAQGLIVIPRTGQRIDYLTNSAGTLKILDIKQIGDNSIGFVGNFNYYQLDLDSFSERQRFATMQRPYHFTQTAGGDLWFATIGGTLQSYHAQSDSISNFELQSFSGATTFPASLLDVFVDNRAYLWLAPLPDPPKFFGGLVRVDPSNNRFKTLAIEPAFNDQVQIDQENWLLASTRDGLFALNTTTQVLARWGDQISNLPSRVLTLFFDSKGTLWVGTEGQGLARLKPQATRFDYFTTDNGLLSNGIMSIIEDDHQQLWLGTSVGLTRFDTRTEAVMNIEYQDGLLFPKFYKCSATKLNNGKIVMGTFGGLVMFDPLDLEVETQPMVVVINDFKRFNQPVALRSADQTSPLVKPIQYTEHLPLSHQDTLFSFGFSALELLRPDLMRYAYKMQGMDDHWVYTDAKNRQASFTTLPAKDYIFSVKARKGNGPWSEQQTTINITITPPWWRSDWAIVAYVLITLFSLLYYIRYRTQKLVARARELEDNVAQRTQQLETSRDELAQKSQAVSDLLAQKQQLFASVSHEFRTPLTLILSPVDNLLRQCINQSWATDLTLIKRNGRRLLRMVDQLLEFAKLEQTSEVQRETVSLQQTLSIICASFEKLIEAKQLSFTVNPFTDVNLTVLADSLNKIIINILSNAVKYTAAKGAIMVNVTTVDGEVAIAIKDTGIGISRTDQSAIFERFNRAIQHHGEAIPGAGIGLSLVKELLEANGGRILLQSEAGQGSTFTLYLPISTETPDFNGLVLGQTLELEVDSVHQNMVVNTYEADELQTTQDQRKTILVVDDNADMRNLLYRDLQPQYHCLLADNGQVGLDLACEHLPDLVVSDIMMPVMDGYELAQKLRENTMTSHIPLILLTAKGSVESRIKGLELLVDDYLSKPFNAQELRLRIHNILTIREILSKRFAQAIESGSSLPVLQQLGINEVEQKFLNQVNKLLDFHYSDPQFTVKVLYQGMAMSERQLQRKLKALFDLTFPELVRNYRLNKAVSLLQSGYRVSDIYFNVGFSSHSYFTNCFKAKFGQTPKAYQLELE